MITNYLLQVSYVKIGITSFYDTFVLPSFFSPFVHSSQHNLLIMNYEKILYDYF